MFSKRQKAVTRRRQYQDGAKLSKAEEGAAAAVGAVRELALILKEHMDNSVEIGENLNQRVKILEARDA